MALSYTYEASGSRQRLKRVTAPYPSGGRTLDGTRLDQSRRRSEDVRRSSVDELLAGH